MRISLLKIVALLSVCVVLNGCLYANTTIPLDINMDKTTLGEKTGEASSYAVLWLFAWGDSGTKAAAENGGITHVNHADRRWNLFLFGLYMRSTTVVYGD